MVPSENGSAYTFICHFRYYYVERYTQSTNTPSTNLFRKALGFEYKLNKQTFSSDLAFVLVFLCLPISF